MTRAVRFLAPAALLAAGACVATSADVDSLRSTINDLRVTQTRFDSARAAQIAMAGLQMAVLDDSVRALSARITKMNGDTRGDLYAINQQLIQIQELTGQSQRRLQELRSSLEQRQADAQAGAAPAAAAAAAPAAPGPSELFQLSLDQLRRGSNATARNGLTLLVTQYPKSDLVPEAQFYIAESWAAEGNAAMADSAYALVVAKYPQSARAPTALYKRALALEKAGNKTAARAAFTQLTTAYPRSDEAALAREQLRTLN